MLQYKNLLYGLLSVLILNSSSYTGQNDTTVIQTLEFSDITKRRGWYVFPSDTNQYQKVLMYYTLKCDAATTQDNYPCGEWDYTTYTRLYDHKNINSPYYFYKNTNPEFINYNNSPKYDIHQSFEKYIVYDSVINESNHIIGLGNTTTDKLFNTLTKSGKCQYIISANELYNQGVLAGSIDKLEIEIQNSGEVLNNIALRIKHTTLSVLTDSTFEKDNLITVYENNTAQVLNGPKTFNFITPFIWDGINNIVVDFTYKAAGNNNSSYDITADDYNNDFGVYCFHNGCLDFKDDDIVDVPSTVFDNIDSAITISFWCYGDEDLMPFNSYIFEGRDSNGYRVINSHLPWSNSRVYWDAGNSGTGSYDRIHQLATINDFSGKWNHWAFTKDVTSGEMKTYLNGELFMSGSGKTKTMDGITSFRIGGNAASGFNGVYDGKIDEFRIWDKSLSQSTINAWMYKSVDASHPDYNHLQAAYDFNEFNGITAHDYSGNNLHGILLGVPNWVDVNPNKRSFNINTTSFKPQFNLLSGTYQSYLDSIAVQDTSYYSPVSIIETLPYIDMNVSGIAKNNIDTIFGFESGLGYTYNHLGNIIDSIDFGIDNQLINYYQQNIHQIQNYVTPYGIGLSLGANGFRWVYDVTDYVTLFNDTVEISAGNQQELIDLKFVFIDGTPPRDVLDFETIWRGDYGHANIANDVSLPPVNILLNPSAAHYKIKTRTTGHWFGGFQNCAEFCPKLHHLKINGTKQFEWLNWKECSNNPVISQGGTWIYDRAGWCPGTFGTTYDHNITPFVNSGDTANIDYGMEVTSGGMEGNYRLTVHLVSYGDYNFQNDAGIVDVIKPNNWEFHNRINPMCDYPKIILTNSGEQPLQSAKIDYWVCGGSHETYTWQGQLEFEDTAEIELPISNINFWDHSQFCKKFNVQITEVNGVMDEYSGNNHYQTSFEAPPIYPNDIVFWTRTNGVGNESKLYVKDINGNIIFSRTSFQNNFLHRDTVNLAPGCYSVILEDTDQDGLSFFANSDGNGTFSIRKLMGAPLQGFDSDFGDRIVHYFTVGYAVNVEDNSELFDFDCFPNPVKEQLKIETKGFVDNINITIYDNFGKIIYSENWNNNKINSSRIISFNEFEHGVYFVKITNKHFTKTKQIIH